MVVQTAPIRLFHAAMQTLRTLEALEREGLVAADPRLAEAAESMAIAITPEMLGLIDRGDLANDPIARQFVPSVAETEIAPEELADPIGDEARSPVKGIVHRYPDRVLLKPLHVCPVYCRFCFRREKVGPGGEALSADRARRGARLYPRRSGDLGGHPDRRRSADAGAAPAGRADRGARRHRACRGDPPAQPRADRRSRPGHRRAGGARSSRAAPPCGSACTAITRASWRPPTRAALGRLADAGIPLMGQTVLLAGVNDYVETLDQLMRALVSARVKPYYLHHPDLVRGTGHFRVSIARGQELMRALRGRLSGLAQPTYVLDVPGGHGKVPIGPGLSRRRSRRARWCATRSARRTAIRADLPSASSLPIGPGASTTSSTTAACRLLERQGHRAPSALARAAP